MRLLAEGTDDEEADAELREDAVSTYVEMLDKQNIPDVLVQIICWVGPVGVVSGCGLGVCPVGVPSTGMLLQNFVFPFLKTLNS